MTSALVEFSIEGWRVNICNGNIILMTNLKDIPVQGGYGMPVKKVFLPLSLNQLLNNYISFGLVQSIFELEDYAQCTAMLVQCRFPGIRTPLEITPIHVTEFNMPLFLFVKTQNTIINSLSLSLAIIFMKPTCPTGICSYISTAPPETIPPQHSLARHMPSTDQGHLTLSGQAIKCNHKTYTMYFRGPPSMQFFKMEHTMASGPGDLQDSCIKGMVSYDIKNIMMEVVNPNGLYKVSVNITSPHKPDHIWITLKFTVMVKPTDLVLVSVLPSTTLPSCGKVWNIYTDSEKILKPGETLNLKLKYTYTRGNESTKAVMFITGTNTNPMVTIEPTIWLPMTPLQVTIKNPTNMIITIKKDLAIAACVPYYSTLEDRQPPASPSVYFNPQDLTITWEDSMNVATLGENIIYSRCHLNLKSENTPSPMDTP
nr:hypothetical protein [Bovine gammaherpesvirus 4]